MKKTIFAFMPILIASLISACATDSEYVDANDTTVAVKNKTRMSSSDWIVSTEQLGKDMLSSANFAEYLEAYKIDADAKIKALEKQGETYSTREKLTMHKPLLMLSTIQNSTDEHIDTRLLTERLREVLFNSGKVRFTTYAAGQGQNIDTATADARNMKFDPNVKKSTVAQKNRVNAFDLTLAGSIIKQTAQNGRSNEISYTFSLTLTDTTTGEGVWTKNLEIKRQHKQGGFGW